MSAHRMLSYSTYSIPCVSLIILAVAAPAHAFELPAIDFDFHAWLFGFNATSASLDDEIQCFGLPYGGIGFASHVITYYTVGVVAAQRSPWMPWRVNDHWFLDFVLASIGLAATTALSVLTMIRCRSRWQFIALAVWKFTMSVTLGITSLVAAFAVRRRLKNTRGIKYTEIVEEAKSMRYAKGSHHPAWWIFLYAPGAIVGLAGLFSIVTETISTVSHVLTITIVFSAVCGGVIILGLIVGLWVYFLDEGFNRGKRAKLAATGLAVGIPSGAVAAGALMMILFAFYSDWVLGAIAGNLSGYPSSDNAFLYWSYFAAKRLPFFSL